MRAPAPEGRATQSKASPWLRHEHANQKGRSLYENSANAATLGRIQHQLHPSISDKPGAGTVAQTEGGRAQTQRRSSIRVPEPVAAGTIESPRLSSRSHAKSTELQGSALKPMPLGTNGEHHLAVTLRLEGLLTSKI